MGLPKINIEFKTKGVTAIKRSERGIVAIIIEDDTTGGAEIEILKSVSDIDATKFTQRNYEYLNLLYAGAPYKVIVIRKDTNITGYSRELKILETYKWNYLTIPNIEESDITMVDAWIKEQRKLQKTFKAVLPKYDADSEGIINFTTDNILSTHSDEIFECNEYCVRIAGLLAGLSLARSSTYYVLNDILLCDQHNDPDKCIDDGEFIIIFDGENYKVGRGVNSLTSFTTEKGEEFSKIKIMEGVDLVNDDIRTTFEDSYVGKYRNDYDTKQLFIASINGYFKSLEGDVLDNGYNNNCYIDVQQQGIYLQGRGTDISTLSDIQIATSNTGSKVFIASNIKFVDAMEDLNMVNYM